MLAAVIVTYNGEHWIRKCLNSLIDSSQPVHIVVIDNGSSDKTIRIIQNEFKNVDLIISDQNLGFGQANNIGIKRAIKAGADFVFLLNQDAWIEKNTIHKLITAYENFPAYGIISPLHLNGEGNLIDHLLYQNITKHPIARTLFSDLLNQRNQDKIYDLTFINAAAWLMTRECIERVGLFDPIFQHYGEDNNYCHRVEYHKLKIGLITDTIIFHDRENRADKKPSWAENNELDLKLRLANILNDSVEKALTSEKKKLYLASTKAIISGKFPLFFNYLKKLTLVKKIFPEIKDSYLRNRKENQKEL
ncbi:glycosyltransferase family 2 protein [Desertivirga xinjiangensis]|uniref:glycosyltransferase family 2 protein n=1 Tax=Desertivirga xinjiangensis TaxID=539206 RepID=UPI002109C15D|nr:glycosyltransferase family 2 protein [Pedobacter xinjiangensis]